MTKTQPRRLSISGLCVFLLVALTACVSSGPRDGAPEENYFDCDVPAASFSEWNRTTSMTTLKVVGTIQLIQTRVDERWVPGANVFLRDRDDKMSAGLQLFVTQDAPNKLQVSLLQGSGGAPDRTVFTANAWKDTPLPFSLELDARGLLTAVVAGVSSSRQVSGFEPHKLALGCSTGQFKFEKVFLTGR
jgi:hypothetical protein